MFCSSCGTQLPDGTQFCPNCGAPLNAQQPPQAPNFNQQNPYGNPPQAPLGVAPLGMKWFKFLIYFLLFAVAIVNVIGGVNAITGANYTVEGENVSALVYEVYSGLQTVDMIYGVACIALGIYQIYTRFQLAKYKANAPKLLLGMYVANAVIVAFYSFAVIGIVPTDVVSHSELMGQGIGSIIGAGVMLWLNKIYFDKRSHLFAEL